MNFRVLMADLFPGSSPHTSQNLLHSLSLKRLSSGQGSGSGKGRGGGDSDVSVVSDARKAQDEKPQRARQPSSSTRPTSPAMSTFFDDTDSIGSATFSQDLSLSPTQQTRKRRPSDFVQYIVPPDEVVSGWAPTPSLAHDASSDSSSAPTRRIPSKSMPSSPTVTKPSRNIFKDENEGPELVLSSPVGFGGGLALIPMPPRRPQSHSAGRARGGSILSDTSDAPSTTTRRPSIAGLSVRSDSALRNAGSADALHRSHTRAAKPSTASTEVDGVFPTFPISPTIGRAPSNPTTVDIARKRSILKKPSFLDMEYDDSESYKAVPYRQRKSTRTRRDSAAQRIISTQTTTSPSVSTPSRTPRISGASAADIILAPSPAVPYAPPIAGEEPDSFLDMSGRMSLDARHSTDESSTSTAPSSGGSRADTMASFAHGESGWR
jgi:hypothetical protein